MPKLKLSDKFLSDVSVGYLYANGKLVLVHKSTHKQAGTVAWVTVHDTETTCAFDGRIVLHQRGVIRLALQAVRIRAKECSIERGSENTKERGIAVGYVSIQIGPEEYYDSVHFNTFDQLLSSDFTYQPKNAWIEAEYAGSWGEYRIAA